MPRKDHSKEVFSIRLMSEDKDLLVETKRKLRSFGKKASSGEILRLGLAFLSDLSEDELSALMNGGRLEIKK